MLFICLLALAAQAFSICGHTGSSGCRAQAPEHTGSAVLSAEVLVSRPRPHPQPCGLPATGPPGKSLSVNVVVYSLSRVQLQTHGLQPARLLCPWNSPGKNTAVGCHFGGGEIWPIGVASIESPGSKGVCLLTNFALFHCDSLETLQCCSSVSN